MTWRTLSSLISEGRAPDHPVALHTHRPIVFLQFRRAVAAVAAKYANSRHVALTCKDSYHFAVGLFGLLHAGADVVLLPNDQTGTLQALSDNFEAVLDDIAIKGMEGTDTPLPRLAGDAAMIMFFTSGSTGKPKRIARSLLMLEREIAVYEQLWGGSDRWSVASTVTHQHLYGLSFKILWSLAAGRPFEAEIHEVWETLLPTVSPQTIVISSPAHLSRLGGIAPLTISGCPRAVFSAGAPLSAESAGQSASVFGAPVVEIFGSTETGAVATRGFGSEDWTLLPGHRLQDNNEGQLLLYSPYAQATVGTADLVEARPNGFKFLGRADRIAKIEGSRVGLADVEAALESLPWIEAAAVVVLPGNPALLGAAVTLTEEGRIMRVSLGNFRFGRQLRQELTATQETAGLPRKWRFVDSLPVHPMGKRRDLDILALFEGGSRT